MTSGQTSQTEQVNQEIDKEFAANAKYKFRIYDPMGDGEMERRDMIVAVKNFFMDDIVEEKQLEREFEQLVAERLLQIPNPNDKIHFEEYMYIMALASRHTQARVLREAFVTIARKNKANRDKPEEELHVDFPAIKKLMKHFAENSISENELDEMVRAADKDGSNTIEIDEFVDYIMGEQLTLEEFMKVLEQFTF